jgi:hypothetical protein
MTQPGNILPHNTLTAAGVLDELKKLKGDKPWVEFELELLCKQFPNNASFKAALDKIIGKTKVDKPKLVKSVTKPQTDKSSKKRIDQ